MYLYGNFPSSSDVNDHPPENSKMPKKMKDYVNRAFASAASEEERDLIHQHLDIRLNEIFAKNEQWGIDWDHFPMPL